MVLCDIELALAETEAAEDLRAAGGEALALGNDISQPAETERLVPGGAGPFWPGGYPGEQRRHLPAHFDRRHDRRAYDRIMNVNLKSVFFLSRAAGNAMKANQWGRIINVSSTGGRTGGIFNATVYSATKAGIMSMTKAFARHFAPDGILVNCIAPGTVNTRLMTNLPEASLETAVSQVPLKRLADAAEIAQVIVFLASEGASYMTGAIVDVNGGAVMP